MPACGKRVLPARAPSPTAPLGLNARKLAPGLMARIAEVPVIPACMPPIEPSKSPGDIERGKPCCVPRAGLCVSREWRLSREAATGHCTCPLGAPCPIIGLALPNGDAARIRPKSGPGDTASRSPTFWGPGLSDLKAHVLPRERSISPESWLFGGGTPLLNWEPGAGTPLLSWTRGGGTTLFSGDCPGECLPEPDRGVSIGGRCKKGCSCGCCDIICLAGRLPDPRSAF